MIYKELIHKFYLQRKRSLVYTEDVSALDTEAVFSFRMINEWAPP